MNTDHDLDLIRRAAAAYLRAGDAASVDLYLSSVEQAADDSEASTRYVRLRSIAGDVLAVYRVRRNDGNLIRLRRPPRTLSPVSALLPRKTDAEAQLLAAVPELLRELGAVDKIIGLIYTQMTDRQRDDLRHQVASMGLAGADGHATRYLERRDALAKGRLLLAAVNAERTAEQQQDDEGIPYCPGKAAIRPYRTR